jgi:nucleoside-specific outer membrane channel protein Tsx
MLKSRFFFVLVLSLIFSAPTFAEIYWDDPSLTLLSGNDYRVGDKNREVLTFEYSAESDWGDHFMFIDYLHSRNGERDFYGELSTRISFSKLFNRNYSSGIIKDYFFSHMLEQGDNLRNNLYGFGVNFNLKPFNYFKVDYYRRINDKAENNNQLTVVWGLPFKIGKSDFVFDGFMDRATKTGQSAVSTNFTSQLKWLISPNLGVKNKVYLGIEYVHWTNKYGIRDSANFRTNERNVNLLLKWHF